MTTMKELKQINQGLVLKLIVGCLEDAPAGARKGFKGEMLLYWGLNRVSVMLNREEAIGWEPCNSKTSALACLSVKSSTYFLFIYFVYSGFLRQY